MKKKLLPILLLVLLIAGLAYACRPSPESMATMGRLSEIEEVNTVEGLTATCSPQMTSRLFKNSITVSLQNDTAHAYYYDHMDRLEIEVDGKWHQLNCAAEKGGTVSKTEVEFFLSAGKTLDQNIDFDFFGRMPAGHYRYVFLCDRMGDPVDEVHYIVAEFTLR